jgi:acyl-CoA thioester hydrolase
MALMQKPQLSRSDYRHIVNIPTRWMDNDIYGHVNNVVYYALFDTAINQYLITEGGLDISGGQVIGVAAETQCQFLQSLAFPEVVEVGLRVGKLGNRSVQYELAIFKQHVTDVAAVGLFVHVFVDRQTRRAVAIPETIRSALRRLCQ